MSTVTRRTFLEAAALIAASTALSRGQSDSPQVRPHAPIRWLDGIPAEQPGTTWGVPWPRGEVPTSSGFSLKSPDGTALPIQSWPLATWPDGSLKWTGHAVAADTARFETLELVPGEASPAPSHPVRVVDLGPSWEIDNDIVKIVIPKSGRHLISSIHRAGRETARHGHLVALHQDAVDDSEDGIYRLESSTSDLTSVTIEQQGPIRAVVKLQGVHRLPNDRDWLPFVVRIYLHAGAESLRWVHSFIFDADEHRDYIRGLGVRFEVPLADELHDRHIRFSGTGEGLFGETVRGVTGLRRDPGRQVREAQVAGRRTPPVESWGRPFNREALSYIPAWGDYTLSQGSADSFEIRKRTKAGHGWIRAASSDRAAGLGYIGGPSGGFGFGQRFFWERHPTRLDIRHAASDAAEVTNWLWSPDAPPMDLRFYHDGLGMENHAQERAGLDITYEDYESGFGTPRGIARTNELIFWAFDSTPPRERFPELARALREPPLLAATPAHVHEARVFGDWSPADRSHPAKARIEERLDALISAYQGQIEQRRWYGFWDHGDVMHTYDSDRNEWRYDVGGYAWANAELSPDLWLWYSYLRSGSANIFRTAEAMTRHTGEVDVHHLGRFKGLGSRHNVQHWGCSCKQLRVSSAVYRRIFYYLTADERTGDLLRDLTESGEAYIDLDPLRKIRPTPLPQASRSAVDVGVGTDWSALAAAWLTEWERTGEPQWRDRLAAGMQTIAAQPHGFFSGGGNINLDTGAFELRPNADPSLSHLSAVFGLAEIASELIDLIEVPAFKQAWLQYCILFNASPGERQREIGPSVARAPNLAQAHSRLTAYAARHSANPDLADRAWREFLRGGAGFGPNLPFSSREVTGPAVLRPVEESSALNTNSASQWGLAAIQLLALAGERIPGNGP